MKHLILAAGIGSLFFLQVFSLQAQNPRNSSALSAPTPTPQPVPDPLTTQRATGQKTQDEEPSAFEKYPVWLLIKPDGIRFLQNQEEIATNQHAIPPNAFLLGCMTVKFEGAAGEQKPDFQLNCEDFVLVGRYGTQQGLEVNGASLTFSTKSKQIQFKGTEKLPLELHLFDDASETRMQADEIKLQLQPGGRPFIRRRSEDNRVVNEHVRVAASSFQVSAKNITALEIIANPAPRLDSSTRGDAPVWDPDATSYSRDTSNIPLYFDPSTSNEPRRNNDPGLQPSPDPGFQPPPDRR